MKYGRVNYFSSHRKHNNKNHATHLSPTTIHASDIASSSGKVGTKVEKNI